MFFPTDGDGIVNAARVSGIVPAEPTYVTLLRQPCSSEVLACFLQRQRYYLIRQITGAVLPTGAGCFQFTLGLR